MTGGATASWPPRAEPPLVYVPVVVYGKQAERAADLAPGDLLGVQGKLVYHRRAPDRHSEQSGRLVVMAHSVVCLVPAPVAVL